MRQGIIIFLAAVTIILNTGVASASERRIDVEYIDIPTKLSLTAQPTWLTSARAEGEAMSGEAGEAGADAAADAPTMTSGTGGDYFAQGTWIVITYGSAGIANTGDTFTGHFGLGYNFYENATISFEFVGGWINGQNGSVDTGIAAFDIFLRYHLFRGEDWSVYIDFGLGIAKYEHDFPLGSLDWDFRVMMGGGVAYRLNQRVWLVGGVRWLHMSNADSEGAENNPGYDAIQFYAGVNVPF